MTKERKSAALSALDKFLRESRWNIPVIPTGLVIDLWLAAIEWADDNLPDECSTTGLGDIPIGRRPIRKNSKTGLSTASAD